METLKLKPIKTSRLHHAEAGQFINRYFEDAAKNNINFGDDPDLELLHNKLDAHRPVYNQALDQIKAQEETEKIALLDQYRDDDVRALRWALKAFQKTREADKLVAFMALNIILNQFKGVEDDNYEQETIRVFNMISLLTDAKHKPLVELLNLVGFVKALNNSNAEFNNLFANRSYENSIKVVYDAKALRQQMFADYKLLTEYVLSMAKVKQNTTLYTDTLNVINNGRQYFSNVIARRKGKSNSSDEPIS